MKVLVDSYPALIEYKLLKDADLTDKISDADYIVNPTVDLLYNKVILINLPIEFPLEVLLHHNKIISRFPINYLGVEVIPYDLPENRKKLKSEDYSLIILNKGIINDLDYAEIVNEGNFLIGNEECIDGNVTLVGQLILRSEVENIDD